MNDQEFTSNHFVDDKILTMLTDYALNGST